MFRKVIPASEKNYRSTCKWPWGFNSSSLADSNWLCSAGGIDTVSSGSIGGAGDVGMGAIETSLAALKEGSALVANVPFIAPIGALILLALQMRGVRVWLVS